MQGTIDGLPVELTICASCAAVRFDSKKEEGNI